MDNRSALNLQDLIEFAADGTVSKTLLDIPTAKITLFCMAAGQELTEHTASRPAIVHFIQGEGEFRLGTQAHAIKPGAWFHLEARAPHALKIDVDTVFVLTLLRG